MILLGISFVGLLMYLYRRKTKNKNKSLALNESSRMLHPDDIEVQ